MEVTALDQQIIVGEKLKAVLRKQYGKRYSTFVYKEITKGKIDLFVTWTTHNFASMSKTFLSNKFSITEAKIGSDDQDNFIICLSEIRGDSLTRLIRHYNSEFPNGKKISPVIVSKILQDIENSEHPSPENLIEKNVKGGIAEKGVEEIDSGKNPKAEVVKIISDSKGPEQSTHTEKVVLEVAPIPNSKQNDFTARTERLALALNPFLLPLLKSEKKFQSPTLVDDSSNLFFYGKPENNMQVIYCKDGFSALNLKLALSWHIADAYDAEPSIFVQGNNIHLDDSFLYEKSKKEKRQKNGTFCFAPNAGTTFDDMEKRLRKVNYMFNSTIEKVDDYFRVMYHTSRSAETSSRVLSSMGWSVKVEGISTLVIFTEFNPVIPIAKTQKKNNTKKEIIKPAKVQKSDNKEIPKNGKESLLPGNDNAGIIVDVALFRKFCGSKQEGIEKLLSIYLDQRTFLKFSAENQHKIVNILEKCYIDEHPEEYAMSIVEFLEKN